jgi:hypothetical protein
LANALVTTVLLLPKVALDLAGDLAVWMDRLK